MPSSPGSTDERPDEKQDTLNPGLRMLHAQMMNHAFMEFFLTEERHHDSQVVEQEEYSKKGARRPAMEVAIGFFPTLLGTVGSSRDAVHDHGHYSR
jgi:hypothetical protein